MEDYIYLNVFSKKLLGRVNDINNYVFKYINSFDRQYFFEYPILNNNDKISLTESGTQNMNIKFNKIDRNNLDITYLLRISMVIPKLIALEEIALTEKSLLVKI